MSRSEASRPPVRIVVVDDHPVFADGLQRLLASVEDLDLVGVASTGTEALTAVERHRPDVVLMDLHLPELSGMEATRRITEQTPEIAVLVLSMLDDDDSVFAALRAGARGYLVKGAQPDEVLQAIRATARGEAVFGASLANRILAYFADLQPRTPPDPFPQLSGREREVLELLANGSNNAAIAGRLYLSPKTVRNHVSNIISKLQVADRTAAILRAREAGLGPERGGYRPHPDR
ncbi:MAG: response regulator transcription factor [Ilumatobacteraceae bacterium]